MDAQNKILKLKNILLSMESVVVAYSGGVDSSFLLKVAFDVLGNKAKGILAISPSFSSREYEKAIATAKFIGAEIEIINTHETEDERYVENPINRCYFCKSELFNKVEAYAIQKEYKNMVDGSNFDDLKDHRPGMQAAKEKKVRSPLQEAGLTKQDIRELSKSLNLPTWDKEALACLSSRFPYGERIDVKKLRMVEDAEYYLYDLGFRNIRARHQKSTLKIEVDPADVHLFFNEELRQKVIKKMKEIGYTYITVDLEGYRRGSQNETLKKTTEIKGNLSLITP